VSAQLANTSQDAVAKESLAMRIDKYKQITHIITATTASSLPRLKACPKAASPEALPRAWARGRGV